MHAWQRFVILGLRLHLRNRMALIYSYVFPTIFLLAFWALYRYDDVPLARHMGELLTITALGGACFGLPTTLVSERERGVWRRYRLTSTSAFTLVSATLFTRYLLLLVAALVQIGLAMALGMPFPRHPLDLWIACTLVGGVLMGLGLTIAALADSVPAVQALGQCIFLPMLILGGVAVPLASLPSWADRLSKFFPGRYAVDAIHATVVGDGLHVAGFSLLALTTIGLAACVAGVKLFRWDSGQRFNAMRGKAWLALAAAAWIAIGVAANYRSADEPRLVTASTTSSSASPNTPAVVTPPPALSTQSSAPAMPLSTTAPSAPIVPALAAPAHKPETTSAVPTGPASWRDSTDADIDHDLEFDHLPPDSGVVTPIAGADQSPSEDVASQLDTVVGRIVEWSPGNVSDPVQRVRNQLAILAVPDVLQQPAERFLPALVFEHLEQTTTKADLVKVLYWIAVHPDDGTLPSEEELRNVGLQNVGSDPQEARNRAAIYAVKLLGRLTGRIAP